MSQGRCQLCEELAELCNSHAIPNAQFRSILRVGGGSAITTKNDATTPITRSSDSWSTDQLCASCEALMNSEYDQYGISVFRGTTGSIRKISCGVSFSNVDVNRIRMFILSILWRMSTSVHDSYLNAHLSVEIKSSLREAFLSREKYTSSKLQVRIQRLHDSTPEGGIRSEDFRNMVLSPFVRSRGKYYSICFLLFGFFVQVYIPSLPASERQRQYILSANSRVFFAPFVEFVDVPELFELGVRSVEKSINGLSRIPDN
jgi:hypothetical protein